MLANIERLAKQHSALSAEAFIKFRTSGDASVRRLVPVDATWYLPNAGKNGFKEFQTDRIPGAVYFDVDGIKDSSSPYPHMMPDASTFNKAMSEFKLIYGQIPGGGITKTNY
jgi:3-mercaptopyruvate sulfurtransferase SseA